MATRKHLTGRLNAAATALLVSATTLTPAARRRRLDEARLERRRLELEELVVRRRAFAHQQRMHWELLARAIDDPSLAAVIDTYDKSIPADKRRQFFYANAWYAYLFHQYRAEVLDQHELYTMLREFFQSPLFPGVLGGVEGPARDAEAVVRRGHKQGSAAWSTASCRNWTTPTRTSGGSWGTRRPTERGPAGCRLTFTTDRAGCLRHVCAHASRRPQYGAVPELCPARPRTGTPLKIVRRIGVPPSARGSNSGASCPDVFELSDGNFAVIGTEATEALERELPSDASRADYERIVVVSRETLIRAKADIPDA